MAFIARGHAQPYGFRRREIPPVKTGILSSAYVVIHTICKGVEANGSVWDRVDSQIRQDTRGQLGGCTSLYFLTPIRAIRANVSR